MLREPPLAAIQHASNEADALACAHCFRYVGSVETQVARRLLARAGGQAAPAAAAGADEEDGPVAEPRVADTTPVDADALQLHALADGSLRLPFSAEHFPLPAPVPCTGGCAAVFCSAKCAQAAWDAHHCLLCNGPHSSRASDALASFHAHARRTNDIFLLAARVIAAVVLQAERTLGGHAAAAAAPPEARFAALRAAWRPYAAAHAVPWSVCVSIPDDVAPADAPAFRATLATLCDSSRTRLAAALPEYASLFPALFSPQLYQHLIGLFELNNLDLVVESPVENYFLYIDDLEDGSEVKHTAQQLTQPLLDALDAGYATPLDGTGFFPFVACANHSCAPNLASLKGEHDVDGTAVLVATRDVRAGEELCVCYIDAPPGASLAQRREALRDYGFVCNCTRCAAEEARAGAAPRRAGKVK